MMVHRLLYFLRRTWENILLTPFASAAGILVLTACLFTLGALSLVYLKAHQIIPTWMAESRVTLYLHSKTPPREMERVAHELRQWPEVDRVSTVTREEARKRLEMQLGEWKSILDGIDENPLPPSIEVNIKGKEKYLDSVDALVEKMRQYPEVEEVFHGKGQAQRLQAILDILKVSGLGMGCLLTLAVVLIISFIVRLSVAARADELEICAMVGATPFFSRAAFYLQGIFQGCVSAVLSAVVLWLFFLECKRALPAPIASAFSMKNSDMLFVCGGLLLCGISLGCLGSWLSVRHAGEI